MNTKDNVRSLFATPMAAFILPNAAQINPGLLRLVLDQELIEGADKSRPIAGWHSEARLTESTQPEILELLDSMRSSVLNMLSIFSGVKRFEVEQKFTAWASVYRSRCCNQPQVQSESSWSGKYIIQAARLGKEHSKLAGQLSFHDPRTRIEMLNQTGTTHKNTFELTPRDGLMLVYPSWLACHLNSFVTDTAMLMISFNSRLGQLRHVVA